DDSAHNGRTRGGAPRDGAPRAAAGGDEPMIAALPPEPDRYRARGRVRLVAGWQEIAGFGDEPTNEQGRARRPGAGAAKGGDAAGRGDDDAAPGPDDDDDDDDGDEPAQALPPL